MEALLKWAAAELTPQDIILLEAGSWWSKFAIQRVDNGQYLLQREDENASADLLDWLLACPSKDWFQPIDSETTDSL